MSDGGGSGNFRRRNSGSQGSSSNFGDFAGCRNHGYCCFRDHPRARAIAGARVEGVVAVSFTRLSEINPAAEATPTSVSQSVAGALAHTAPSRPSIDNVVVGVVVGTAATTATTAATTAAVMYACCVCDRVEW